MTKFDVKDQYGGKVGEVREGRPDFFTKEQRFSVHDEYGGKVGELHERRDYEGAFAEKAVSVGFWGILLMIPFLGWLFVRFPLTIGIILAAWGAIIQNQPYDGGTDSAAFALFLYIGAAGLAAFQFIQSRHSPITTVVTESTVLVTSIVIYMQHTEVEQQREIELEQVDAVSSLFGVGDLLNLQFLVGIVGMPLLPANGVAASQGFWPGQVVTSEDNKQYVVDWDDSVLLAPRDVVEVSKPALCPDEVAPRCFYEVTVVSLGPEPTGYYSGDRVTRGERGYVLASSLS